MSDTTTAFPYVYNKRIQTHDVVLTGVTSCASIIGACFLFFCHYARYRRGMPLCEVRQYLLCLTFADMINASGQLMGLGMYVNSSDNTDIKILACHKLELPGCKAQSYVTTVSSMSSFFWTTVIALHLYLTYDEPHEVPRWHRNCRTAVYHIASWGIPLTITTTAASMNVLGSDLSVGSGAWCWISACLSHTERTLWMTMSGKLWEVLMYFSCMAFYMLMKVRKKKLKSRRSIQRHSITVEDSTGSPHEDLRFLFLWLIEVGLRIWGTIRYMIAVTKRHTDVDISGYTVTDNVFLSLQSVGDSAQAFCSFLLFCVFDREMRNILKEKLCYRQRDPASVPLLDRKNHDIHTSKL